MYSVKSNFRLKDIDSEKKVISAYVSVFGNVDTDGDMVVKGAFKKTISERGPGAARMRIKHLWMHDPFSIIGIPETMEEDDTGLLVRSKFGTDTFSADKFQQHIDGLVDEFSIGYQVMQSDKADDHTKLTELKLWEYSSVTWGANELTRIVEGKGCIKEQLEMINERMNKLTTALRKGKYTDETAEQFEIELKQIQTIYNDLITLKSEPDTTHEQSPDGTLDDEQIADIFKTLNK